MASLSIQVILLILLTVSVLKIKHLQKFDEEYVLTLQSMNRERGRYLAEWRREETTANHYREKTRRLRKKLRGKPELVDLLKTLKGEREG